MGTKANGKRDKPTHLAEHDRMEVSLAVERVVRLRAQRQLVATGTVATAGSTVKSIVIIVM
jgi:citrate lyase synthetase